MLKEMATHITLIIVGAALCFTGNSHLAIPAMGSGILR
jgi:hypothetical protein